MNSKPSFIIPLYSDSSNLEHGLRWLNKLFALDRSGSSAGRELVAGLTTFTTMSYIVVVNPAILSAAGVPEGPSFVATVLVAAIGCYLMAFYANRPFAIAPYMGENAFIAFTVCKVLGIPLADGAGRHLYCRLAVRASDRAAPAALGSRRRAHVDALQLRGRHGICSSPLSA